MEQAKRLLQESHNEFGAMVIKGGAGITASVTALTLNDIIGLVVGILTAIYMVFQIEAAYRKRKIARLKEQEFLDEYIGRRKNDGKVDK